MQASKQLPRSRQGIYRTLYLRLIIENSRCGKMMMMMIPVLIRFCPRQRRWPDVSFNSLLDTFSPFCSIVCILSFETSLLHFYLDLIFPCISWSSSPSPSIHFKLQRLSQNIAFISSQNMTQQTIALHLLMPSYPKSHLIPTFLSIYECFSCLLTISHTLL